MATPHELLPTSKALRRTRIPRLELGVYTQLVQILVPTVWFQPRGESNLQLLQIRWVRAQMHNGAMGITKYSAHLSLHNLVVRRAVYSATTLAASVSTSLAQQKPPQSSNSIRKAAASPVLAATCHGANRSGHVTN